MVQGIDPLGSNIDSLLQTGGLKSKNGKANPDAKADYKISFQEETLTAVTYNRSAKIETGDADGNITELRQLVSRLLERQGITWQEAMNGTPVEVDEETRAEAQSLIAEDGYWGVEKTSERIFQFAVANAGGDAGKLDEIKAAVQNGFDMAKEALGGTLPEISMKTFDAVMEKLDSWSETETPAA